MYRLIPSEVFLKTFSSDRSHMALSEKMPPAWPIIQNDGKSYALLLIVGSVNNLQQFIDMGALGDGEYGRVLEEPDFLEFCGYAGPETRLA
jgi:hypothetical protein